MHHTMANRINLIKRLDHAYLRVGQQREDEFHALRMLGDIMHNLFLLTIWQLHFHKSVVESHTLSATRRHHALIIHIIQCVLDG